jgi:hypothetical protein
MVMVNFSRQPLMALPAGAHFGRAQQQTTGSHLQTCDSMVMVNFSRQPLMDLPACIWAAEEQQQIRDNQCPEW